MADRFFSLDGLNAFVPSLQQLSAADRPVKVLVGSNDGETLAAHVEQLAILLGLPRPNANLGIVSYSGAYYHPKTYHLRRDDGSQAAYVGSANLTSAGIGSLHIEAGILLDTLDGDSPSILDDIASAVDEWFHTPPPGLELIADASDVSRLTAAGILAIAPPPKTASPSGGGNTGSGAARPRLQPLIRFPSLVGAGTTQGAPTTNAPASTSPGAVAPTIAPTVLPAAPQSPYPPYILFAPGANTPTSGTAALTGATLPGGYSGLVIRLNRDSARHWRGGSGTANISVPVATISTLRFGIFQGQYQRPRAEYDLEMRYVYQGGELRADRAPTNVMAYGFAPGEVGHGDVRMVVPAGPARQILALVQQHGLATPADGDAALLEWPDAQNSNFRLTLLERQSALAVQASNMLANAAANNQIVGAGACWLPPTFAPPW